MEPKQMQTIIAGLKTGMIEFDTDKYTFTCTCDLACPHPLVIEEEGRIIGGSCSCVHHPGKPCICATHSLTFYLCIKGGALGEIKIDLAGRSNPYAVNRFYKAAKNNFYAGLIFDHVVKDEHLNAGLFNKGGKESRFYFNDDEKTMSSVLLTPLTTRKYSVGFWERPDCLDVSAFRIFMGETGHPHFQTIGAVVEGFDLIDRINELPTDATKIGRQLFKMLPKQMVTIRKCAAEIYKKRSNTNSFRVSLD